MFVRFFYALREAGIPVSPTAFLTLHKAIRSDLVNGLDDFYIAARSILVKSERHFDLYDQIFDHVFAGAELPDDEALEDEMLAMGLLRDWLENPKVLAAALGPMAMMHSMM